MHKWILRAIVLAAVGLLTILGTRPTAAASPQTASASYTFNYSYSTDPNDTGTTDNAVFPPDTQTIYIFAWLEADPGSPPRQAEVGIDLLDPNGTPVDTDWYRGDGTVTSVSADEHQLGDGTVVTKELKVAGTANAQRTGAWTVNLTLDGKLAASANFSIEGTTEVSADESAVGGEQALTDAGYTVLEFDHDTGSDGTPFAWVYMQMASQDVYSAETAQQLVDGWAALENVFPEAQDLDVWLLYDDQYDLLFHLSPAEFDAYLKTRNYDDLTFHYNVYDKQKKDFVGAKDFFNKNFGAGNWQPPSAPPLSKHTAYGSLQVQTAPQTLPADGKSQAKVTVRLIDKHNQPMSDAEIDFTLAGSGGGKIRPGATSTDENGQATATYTAGTKIGSITITAKAGDTIGTAVVNLGGASNGTANTDPSDEIIAFMSQEGFTVVQAGFFQDSQTDAGVVLDLGTSISLKDLSNALESSFYAMRKYLPTATSLYVIVPSGNNKLYFGTSAATYDAYIQAFAAATSDSARSTVVQNFYNGVFGKALVVDAQGNTIGFKDFMNKSFSGG